MAENHKLYKTSTGTNTLTAGLIFKTNAPLDDRFVVADKAALIGLDVFGTESNKDWMYDGLITTVYDDSTHTTDVYILHNKTELELFTESAINNLTATEIDNKIAKGWTRLAKASEVNTVAQNLANLSGLWHFEGIASSVNPDFTIITVTPLEYDSKLFSCTEYKYDINGDKYCKWESDENSIYTKDEDNSRTIYTGTSQSTISVEHDGVTYIYDDVENGKTKLTTIDENSSIYADSELDIDNLVSTSFYNSASDQTDAIFTETPVKNTIWTFTETNNTYTSGTGIKIDATVDNNGYVYQIGDKEYASNGLIWVELGSPDNGWIIL